MPSPLSDLETPALLLDRARFERNVERMRSHIARWPGVVLRPHLKTAKCLEVAERVAPNRGPITVSTLREAEVFAAHGYNDITYAVGIAPDKLARVARLSGKSRRLTIILDSLDAARRVDDFAMTEGVVIPTLIEVDTDGHRGGIRPADRALITIGSVLAKAGALQGLLTHAGGSYNARSDEELVEYARKERNGAVDAAERLHSAGLPSPVVSIGSTPTALFTRNLEGVTEVRAGVYMFQDLVMAGLGVCEIEEIALSVLTTVIGHQSERGQVIVDAGWMALSRDRGTQHPSNDCGYGLVCEPEGRLIDGLVVSATNQEHGIITARGNGPLDPSHFPIGTKLRILPNHSCATAAQHPAYKIVEGSQVVAEWERFGHW
jgi:D-serine deaminase-like pyridoxal phosphate-dependent protein